MHERPCFLVNPCITANSLPKPQRNVIRNLFAIRDLTNGSAFGEKVYIT